MHERKHHQQMNVKIHLLQQDVGALEMHLK